MRRIVLAVLVAANLASLVLLLGAFTVGEALEVRFGDLRYGAIDLDGDGRCTYGDDRVAEWLAKNQPRILFEALKTAKVRLDGAVDLSAHLASKEFSDVITATAGDAGDSR